TAQTLGSSSRVDTPPADTLIHVPDLTISKTHSGSLAGGAHPTFQVVVSNVGLAPSRGLVTVTDTLADHFSFAGDVTGGGWDCSTSGQPFPCPRSDSLDPHQRWPPILAPVRIDRGTPAGELVNVVEVSGGEDGNPANNTDTDSVIARIDLAI